jgi:predicted GIY-YIG superfamily endonuclease
MGKLKNPAQLYRCTKCPAVFWDRRVLHRNLSDKDRFSATLMEAKVPTDKVQSGQSFVYVILLSKPSGAVYVGMTGRHPYERYINHLRGHKASRYVRRFGRAMKFFEGPMNWEDAQNREVALANELRESGNTVFGGH